MITANQVRKGIAVQYRGDVYEVVDFQHIKPGKGGAFVKLKLKSFTTQRVLEDTIRPEDKLEDMFLEEKKYQFLYKQGNTYVFMDQSTYNQIELDKAQVEHVLPYLIENMEVTAREGEGRLYDITLPKTVELKIVETVPNFKGDTNTGGKPAKLESGATVMVPFFVEQGELVRVDTRTGEYLGRAKS